MASGDSKVRDADAEPAIIAEGRWRGLRYRVCDTPEGPEYLLYDQAVGWWSLGVLDADQVADGLTYEEQLRELMR